jgi:hypothetical protein
MLKVSTSWTQFPICIPSLSWSCFPFWRMLKPIHELSTFRTSLTFPYISLPLISFHGYFPLFFNPLMPRRTVKAHFALAGRSVPVSKVRSQSHQDRCGYCIAGVIRSAHPHCLIWRRGQHSRSWQPCVPCWSSFSQRPAVWPRQERGVKLCANAHWLEPGAPSRSG